jgi:predicted AAA+ superfamily ATPase
MRRFITKDLLKWKQSPRRKPLILQGARQVGKTFIVKDFGSTYYDNYVYFNFDENKQLTSLFDTTKEPERILEQLSIAAGQKITPGKTLIFFDEIQECDEALNALKYFQEKAPEQHVIAAGSLLGIKLSRTSFPVGKVNFLDLYPMSFPEFLLADGQENLVQYLDGIDTIEAIPELFAAQLTEKLKAYYLVGGMPEVVASWVAHKDIDEVHQIQYEILRSYEKDFAKHVTTAEANKISLIWHSIPSQLARENKKFVYQAIREGARAREYEDALNWLRDAGLIYKVTNVKAPKLPLSAYEDLSAFKIYLLDIGLLCYMSGIDTSTILDNKQFFTEFKGALNENFVLEALTRDSRHPLFYYDFDRYSIDFMLQHNGKIFPIEVKSSNRSTHASITNYIVNESPELAVRFSTKNLVHDSKILNIPLFLASYAEKLIDMV